ncbi:MAG: PEP-CTERM sorting domain-containing protein [Sideroxyarcus sp.]
MKNHVTGSVAAAILFVASPAWAAASFNGASFNGGLQTIWSSDLGRPYDQPIHPATAINNDGTTTPATPTNHMFANESVTVTLAAKGLSGTETVSAPATGSIEGGIYHYQAVLTTPQVGYYGLGLGSTLGADIYFSGVSSNTLYYGLRLSETGSGPSHSFHVGGPGVNFNSTASNYSQDFFGSTNLGKWSGGSLQNSFDGSGFVGFSLSANSMNPSGSNLPGATQTFDMWLTFSETPITAMPNTSNITSPVPEPETNAMMMAGLGLLGFVSRRRSRKAA